MSDQRETQPSPHVSAHLRPSLREVFVLAPLGLWRPLRGIGLRPDSGSGAGADSGSKSKHKLAKQQ